MEVLNSRQHVTGVTPPTDGGVYPAVGPWAIRRALGSFSSDLAQPGLAGLSFSSEQVLPIQGSHLRRNANRKWPVGLGGAYERVGRVVGRLESHDLVDGHFSC